MSSSTLLALVEPPAAPLAVPTDLTVAVLGLGYVGLPTALALGEAGFAVVGIDVSPERLDDIRALRVDALPADRARLARALGDETRFHLSTDAAALREADAVLICVPTPVDEDLQPDLRILRAACATTVAHARPDQTIVLTSTSYVGTTRELLIEPLRARGLHAGEDVFVAFSPERIDPGNERHEQASVPRVVGATSEPCAMAAASVLERIAARLHIVSSPEAAELTKLYENTFRAVNIAFANEMAGVSRQLGLDPIEVIDAAATKPYGFMPFYPGAGVGGHCIPCDPHYLLEPLRAAGFPAPLIQRAMNAIAHRPVAVVERAAELLRSRGIALSEARVLMVGVAYKAGIQDVRESPAIQMLNLLAEHGARIAYHDPLVPRLRRADDPRLNSVAEPRGEDFDLAIIAVRQPGDELAWLSDWPLVLDCTYRIDAGRERHLI